MPLMPGMLTPQQMKALAKASGPAFDRLFLTGMIQHHTGALIMVEDLFDTAGAGQDNVLYDFATDMDNTQRAEIEIMKSMLRRRNDRTDELPGLCGSPRRSHFHSASSSPSSPPGKPPRLPRPTTRSIPILVRRPTIRASDSRADCTTPPKRHPACRRLATLPKPPGFAPGDTAGPPRLRRLTGARRAAAARPSPRSIWLHQFRPGLQRQHGSSWATTTASISTTSITR